MKVKHIKTKKEFKPVTLELTFENEKEVHDLYALLRATSVEWDSNDIPCYGGFDGLRDALSKELGIVKY